MQSWKKERILRNQKLKEHRRRKNEQRVLSDLIAKDLNNLHISQAIQLMFQKKDEDAEL